MVVAHRFATGAGPNWPGAAADRRIYGMLKALMVRLAAACVIFQALVLIEAEGLVSLWRDFRGQLLLMALYACAMNIAVRVGWPDALHWQVFSYLVLGFAGVVLVLQPVPGWSGRVREAHP